MTARGQSGAIYNQEMCRMTPAEWLGREFAVRAGVRHLVSIDVNTQGSPEVGSVDANSIPYPREILGGLALVTEDDLVSAPADRQMPAPPFLKPQEVLLAEDYPDVPFYRGILGRADIPLVDPPPSEQALVVQILGTKHIAVGGKIFELRGERLYMFNALLAHRDQPTHMSTFVSHGFREASSPEVTASRANKAMRGVCQMFAKALPEGSEAILQFGSRNIRRQLSPLLVLEDMRGTLEAHEAVSMFKGGCTLNDIAKAAGVRFGAARLCTTDEEWEMQFDGPAGLRLFPDEVAHQIFIRCKEYKESFVAVKDVSENCGPVLDMVRSLPYYMSTRRALRLLTEAGYTPFRVRTPSAARSRGRGGRWCVRKEGARDVLLAAFEADIAAGVALEPRWHRPKRNLPPSTLDSIMPKPISPPEMSTADEVAIELVEEYDLEVTLTQIEEAASRDPLIRPVLDDSGELTYSPYAIRRIIAALVLGE